MKTNIAVLFGCRSVEHEVSIISAVQAMRAIQREKYDVTPIYVTKSGEMYTGNALFEIEKRNDGIFGKVIRNRGFFGENCKFVTLHPLRMEKSIINMHNTNKMIHEVACASKNLI